MSRATMRRLGGCLFLAAMLAGCQRQDDKPSLKDCLAVIQSKRFVDLTHAFEPGIPHWPGFADEKQETIYWYDGSKGTMGKGFYRIVQESLANARKHRQSKKVKVSLVQEGICPALSGRWTPSRQRCPRLTRCTLPSNWPFRSRLRRSTKFSMRLVLPAIRSSSMVDDGLTGTEGKVSSGEVTVPESSRGKGVCSQESARHPCQDQALLVK